jgi:tRNA pseudouridine55 synthase
LNGILNIIKPPGMTSFDVVNFLKRKTGMRRVGHTGTLDPAAAGVMAVCFGKATGAVEFMSEDTKEYTGELTLGITTDTQDATGNILSENSNIPEDEEIITAFSLFTGELVQTPPMFSAVSVNGTRLYSLARKGIEIERPCRKITVFRLEITDIDRMSTADVVKVIFHLECSKGTYVRTLCCDIGSSLGCGGHMSFLVRTRSGVFSIEDAVTIEEINSMPSPEGFVEKLHNPECVFLGTRYICLDDILMRKFCNGVYCDMDAQSYSCGEILRVYDSEMRFVALGCIIGSGDKIVLKNRKLFI